MGVDCNKPEVSEVCLRTCALVVGSLENESYIIPKTQDPSNQMLPILLMVHPGFRFFSIRKYRHERTTPWHYQYLCVFTFFRKCNVHRLLK